MIPLQLVMVKKFLSKINPKIVVYFLAIFIVLIGLHISGITKIAAMKFGLYNEFKINDTEIILEEVKKIGQIYTQKFYDEFYYEEEFSDPSFVGYVHNSMGEFASNAVHAYLTAFDFTKRSGFEKSKSVKLGFVVNGHVTAGFDLEKFDDKSIIIDKESNTLTIRMPIPEVLETVVNPSGYNTFISDGNIPFEFRKNVQIQAKLKLKARAIKYGILEKSENYGKKVFEQFFMQLGFDNVSIELT